MSHELSGRDQQNRQDLCTDLWSNRRQSVMFLVAITVEAQIKSKILSPVQLQNLHLINLHLINLI